MFSLISLNFYCLVFGQTHLSLDIGCLWERIVEVYHVSKKCSKFFWISWCCSARRCSYCLFNAVERRKGSLQNRIVKLKMNETTKMILGMIRRKRRRERREKVTVLKLDQNHRRIRIHLRRLKIQTTKLWRDWTMMQCLDQEVEVRYLIFWTIQNQSILEGGPPRAPAPGSKPGMAGTQDPNYQTLAGLNNDAVFGGGAGGPPKAPTVGGKAATNDPNYQVSLVLRNLKYIIPNSDSRWAQQRRNLQTRWRSSWTKSPTCSRSKSWHKRPQLPDSCRTQQWRHLQERWWCWWRWRTSTCSCSSWCEGGNSWSQLSNAGRIESGYLWSW